jgi:hypothetical protein
MEMHSEILKPMAVLAAWTMFMWLWMYVTRIPAMSKAGVDTGSLTGGTGKDLDGVIPDNIQWKAHNYNHLHEAPTVFYAVALAGNGRIDEARPLFATLVASIPPDMPIRAQLLADLAKMGVLKQGAEEPAAPVK